MTRRANCAVVLSMRWSRLWVLLSCLLCWGSGSALPASGWTSASTANERSAQGFSTAHARIADIEDAESDDNASIVERLRLQSDAYAAPAWEQSARAPRDWRHERVALRIARRATAPPLAGIVELLI